MLAAATGVNQASSVVIAPVLSRLYSPSAFGAYAAFYATAAIVGTVVGLSLHNAVLLEPDDEAALHTASSALLISVILSGALLTLLMFVPAARLQQLVPGISPRLLFFLPFTVLGSVVFQLGYTCLLRLGKFNVLSVNYIVLGAVTSILQIVIGSFRLGALGLIASNLIGYVVASILIWIGVLRASESPPTNVNLRSAGRVYRRHRRLVVFTMPATLINNAATAVPNLLVGRLFGASVLGQYSLGMRVVGLPLTLISTTAQDVFRREASLESVSGLSCQRAFRRWFTIMVVTALFVLVPVLLAIPWVLPLVFGPEWSESAIYVQALAALLIVRYVSSPLSYVWIITGRQHQDLFWQLGLLGITVASLLVPSSLWPDTSAVNGLMIFSFAAATWYLFALIMSYRWARIPQPRPEP